MSTPPKTPNDWMLFFAELADKHPLETMTTAGAGFQQAIQAFLVDAGMSGASTEDLRADLMLLLPRLCNAIVQSEHAGAPCRVCSNNFAYLLHHEITKHMNEIASLQNTGGLH